MAYEVGASLAIRNAQHLTPLTLSAKLARIEMFFHILNIEREIYWQIGSITCAAYPLSQVDTIDVTTGSISHNNALNLVVFGVSQQVSLSLSLLLFIFFILQEKDEHLELMDGMLIDLLNAKWNTFVKSRFYRQFFLFCFYFVLSLISFTLRPGPASATITPTTTPATYISETESSNNIASTIVYPTNVTDRITIDLQNSTLFLLLDKVVTTAVSSSLTLLPRNVTQTSLEKLKRDIVFNVTSALKNIFSLDRPNENKHLHVKDDAATVDRYLEMTSNGTTSASINTQTAFDDVTSTSDSDKNDWYVAGNCIRVNRFEHSIK